MLDTDFVNRFGHRVVRLALADGEQRHFFYEHVESGRRFDVRDLPNTFIGSSDSRYTNERQLRVMVECGDATAHQRAIHLALLHGYDFCVFHTRRDVSERILAEGLSRACAPHRLQQIAANGDFYFGRQTG